MSLESSAQFVDPAVSRTKFQREVEQYRRMEDEYIKRGWWLLKAEFPEIFLIFGTPALRPPTVVFGAIVDFTNYDLWAPSVKLVDPFTRIPYRYQELPTRLPRATRRRILLQAGSDAEPVEILQEQHLDLMQAHAPGDVPFLCFQGVREYHDHPAHSGDSWLLYRGQDMGTVYHILDVLYRYGVVPIKYRINMNVGYQVTEVPE